MTITNTYAIDRFQTGPWTYTIERFRNPQPHFVQVMASPKSPIAPVVRTRFWTNLESNYLSGIGGDVRNKRDVLTDIEDAENDDWSSQTSFPNVVNQPIGRSYESESGRQEPENSLKTTRSFSENVNTNNDGDLKNVKTEEYKRSSGYRITLDDLKKSQESGRSKNILLKTSVMKPVILYVEVKSGMWPVRGARVEVTVTKRAGNDTNKYKEKFELLDTGSGGKFIHSSSTVSFSVVVVISNDTY